MLIVSKLNKKLFYILFVLSLLMLGGVSFANFFDKSNVLGSTFSVASSDIKLLQNNTLGTNQSNLIDYLDGPDFDNINPYWQKDYLIKIYNNGSANLDIISNSDFLLTNDPKNISKILFVEIIEWNDANSNGVVDEQEGVYSFGKKSFEMWKAQGINIGTINKQNLKGYILRFTTQAISDDLQGATALFDFTFNSTPSSN